MNVSLTPELENFVQSKVSSGRYTSASEALRLLEDQDKARAAHLKEFRSELDRRLASLDRREAVEGGSTLTKGRGGVDFGTLALKLLLSHKQPLSRSEG